MGDEHVAGRRSGPSHHTVIMASSPGSLLLLALAAIAVLVVLVTWRKMNAFVALFIAALLVGFGAGLSPAAVLKSFQEGLGATMGGIAMLASPLPQYRPNR